jgi:Flp pilus assembly protein TadB
MLISTVVFLFFLFLIYALFLLSSRKSDARQVRMQKRVAEALQDFDSQEQQIHISRQDSIGGHPTINRVLSSLDFVKQLDRHIRQADMQITVSRLLVFCFFAGALAFLAAVTVMNIVLAFVPAGLAAMLPLLYVTAVRKKRLLKINKSSSN